MKSLAELKVICEAATPGEWTLSTKHKSILLNKDGKQFAIVKHMLLQDRKFITTFNPAVVRRLLEVVERQREALEFTSGSCSEFCLQNKHPNCSHVTKEQEMARAALAQDAHPTEAA